MNKKSFMITILAVFLSLYCFPHQDGFWAYLSIPYVFSVFNLAGALYFSTKYLRTSMSYLVELSACTLKTTILILFYTSVPVILYLFLPKHTVIIFFLFCLYQWRVFKEKRGIYLTEKGMSKTEK